MAVTLALPKNFLLRAHVILNLYTGNQYYINSEFRHTSKNFEGGLPKHFREKHCFLKKSCQNMLGRLTVSIKGIFQ
jgi:hypothetical protein